MGHSVFLFEVAHSDIRFAFENPAGLVPLLCDRRQIGQAVTNILKNAVESITDRKLLNEPDYAGIISVAIEQRAEKTLVIFTDNGAGLPPERERIIEPYVTTRARGSGLGLAIVNKILDEHKADIRFDDNPEGGAIVTLAFANDRIALDLGEPKAG